MKKRYRIPLILVIFLTAILLFFIAVKLIFPLQPRNTGFHFEESETVLIDRSNTSDTDLDVNTFWWHLIDERYAVFQAGDMVVKMDIETAEITAQAPLAEGEGVRGITHRDNGNIFAGVYFIDGETTTEIVREYTSDLTFIRDMKRPEMLAISHSAFADDVFYYAANDLDTDITTLYTYDENLKLLTSEVVDKSFMVAHSRATPMVKVSADGKPFIHWNAVSTDPDDPKPRKSLVGSDYHEKFYITSFEAKPTTVIELPQKDAFDNYMCGAEAGQGEYPIYVYYTSVGNTWLDVVCAEILRGEAIVGVKWDGTAEKVAVTEPLHYGEGNNLNINVSLFMLGMGVVGEETIYVLEKDYGSDTTGPRLILRKLTKVYD
jgi:hypothetical protein